MRAQGCSAVIYQADSRSMPEVQSGSVPLIVTSPPYWQIKDYGIPGQIGHGQGLHAYLADLSRVWQECHRATAEGGRLCVNIGDQFARATLYGRYRVIPLHAEVIGQCVACGFDYMGAIIWRKKTTMNTSGGATVMGSYPHPANGIVEIDFEFILLFRKPGPARKVDKALKESAAMSREEWKCWFSGHWDVAGARKKGHEAPFPDEIPRRLIRMFSFPGDLVLDPFLGTGTTARVALELGRDAVGYEISADFARMAAEQIRQGPARAELRTRVDTPPDAGVPHPSAHPGHPAGAAASRGAWTPRVPDLAMAAGGRSSKPERRLRTVVTVQEDCSLVLEDGTRVVLDGVRIENVPEALSYLRQRVLKKKVSLDATRVAGDGMVRARVALKNRISINSQLEKIGVATRIAIPGR
jgi:DNA modification methylase